MTGYASATGHGLGYSWVWELRSVNARGLDLRLRIPDWIEGLEPLVRAGFKGRVARGNLNLTLRVNKDADAASLVVNQKVLTEVLSLVHQVETAAKEGAGVSLAAANALDILNQKGVLDQSGSDDDTTQLRSEILNDLSGLIDSFNTMRATEGQTLNQVLSAQIDQIDALRDEARAAAESRKDKWADVINANLERALENLSGADPERVAQELALIVVKADVTEELDRLGAHVATARELLTNPEPVGRKLDFLAQEFNREANTLCSKSHSQDLTRIGLDLKVVIDQMREQVQNVE